MAPDPSPFERDLQPILDTVAKRPELAPAFAQMIAARPVTPDWSGLTGDPVRRADVLLASPPRDSARRMLEPLSISGSLVILARRVASDEAYLVDRDLRALTVPSLWILGANDRVVSNAVTRSSMSLLKAPALRAVVVGGGHYIQDLQYPLFHRLLHDFLAHGRAPATTVRIAVESVGSTAAAATSRPADSAPNEAPAPRDEREAVC